MSRPSARRARPVLALASLIPLAAGTALVLASPARDESAAPAATSVQAGPLALTCDGPLEVPGQLQDGGGDAQLGVIPPSGEAGLRAVALERDSSLLFGRTDGTETRRDGTGRLLAPEITARGILAPDAGSTGDGSGTSSDAGGASDAGGDPAGSDGTGSDGTGAEDTGTAGPAIALTGDAQDLGSRVAGASGLSGPVTVTLAAADGGQPIGDAVRSTTTTEGDFRSLSLTRCAAPTTDATFLGAGTAEGDSSALVLRNDSDRPATASVQAWTADGPAEMQGRSRLVVAPHTTQRLLLESIVPGQSAIGVRATSVGAPLAMSLQTTARSGLTPQGAEVLDALPQAAQDLSVPGVLVAGTAPTVQLLNTSARDASVDLAVQGGDGEITAAAQQGVSVPAGSVVEVALAQVPDGLVTVTARSDQPVLATVESTVTGPDLPGDTIGAPADLAIAAPAATIGGSAVLALPAEGPDGLLALAADEDTAVTVIPLAADGTAGDAIPVDVTAGSTASLLSSALTGTATLPAALVIVPEQPGVLHAAWVQASTLADGGRLLSTLTAQPAAAAPPEETVQLG